MAAPHDYIKTWNEFELFDGVATAIKKLNDAQYIVCVVTNQRGVAQGIMSMEDVNEIHKQMQCKLELSGAHLLYLYVLMKMELALAGSLKLVCSSKLKQYTKLIRTAHI